MQEEKVYIYELEGGEVNILNAENDTVKLTKTGMFLCKEGEVTLSIDDTEYHMERHSIIIYFSYSTLHIISHSPDLRGTLIGGDLDTIQPLLYLVTNFNALFFIKKEPYQVINDAQYDSLCKHISLLTQIIKRKQAEQNDLTTQQNSPIKEINNKQAELLGNSLILEILQCYTNVEFDSTPLSRKDEVLQKFVAQLYRTYRTEHEVGYYAEQQFLTSRYFSSIVKDKSGKSPSQWIATALLVDAQNLLKTTNMTIKEISDVLNFPNQSYFGKWFKNLTDIGPLDYRKGKIARQAEDNDFTDIVQRGIDHISNTTKFQ
jgi:AraC-like DNA-binding protein